MSRRGTALSIPDDQRDDLEALSQAIAAGVAPHLAVAVHKRNAARIADLLTPLDHQELLALAVVLANQIVIDDVAVERAADGERIGLTWAERAAAVELLVRRGHTLTEITRRLRLSGTTARQLVDAIPPAEPTTTEGAAA